jgi:2-hydroxy-3-oxopropionate reductase
MGQPMAMNLLNGGFPLAVYSRRTKTHEPLRSAGAAAVGTPAELAAGSDVVITMVTGTQDVEDVLFGPGGIVHGARPGLVHIDMSTISPIATRDMADRLMASGIEMLDAPVSGGPVAARAGTLLVMVGGRADVFARMKPVLELLGGSVVHLGPHGAGQAAKACNQLLVVMTALGVAEALHLAEALGLEPSVVQRTLMGGLAASRVLELFGSRMASRNFDAGIDTRLYHKDLGIVMELLERLHVDAPVAALTKQYVDRLMARGHAHDDLAALITVAGTSPS